MWCYFCSNSNTRKVEALGGHLFVPGQVGDADIEKKTTPCNRPGQNSFMVKFSDKSEPFYCQLCGGN